MTRLLCLSTKLGKPKEDQTRKHHLTGKGPRLESEVLTCEGQSRRFEGWKFRDNQKIAYKTRWKRPKFDQTTSKFFETLHTSSLEHGEYIPEDLVPKSQSFANNLDFSLSNWRFAQVNVGGSRVSLIYPSLFVWFL